MKMSRIYNPVTRRWIQNTARNRRNILDQMLRYRQTTFALISCSKVKEEGTMRAEEMYCSPLFQSSKSWATNRGLQYGILSAKYPELANPARGRFKQISTYDLMLSKLSKKERQQWAAEVADEIEDGRRGLETKEIVMLAGKTYTSELQPELKKRFPNAKIVEPLEGKQIGERLRWFRKNRGGQTLDKNPDPVWPYWIEGPTWSRGEPERTFIADLQTDTGEEIEQELLWPGFGRPPSR